MKLKKILKKILVEFCYLWGGMWYDKKYLKGIYFDRNEFTLGWKWILQYWFQQKILRRNAHIPFPVPDYMNLSNINNIEFDLDDMRNFHMVGCYYQCINAKIRIGKGTYIAQGSGIITSNHDLDDLKKSAEGKDVLIGERCWIGMNAVIMPGVILGDHTIVGAGAVVTKSFPEGNCVIAGNPARKMRDI